MKKEWWVREVGCIRVICWNRKVWWCRDTCTGPRISSLQGGWLPENICQLGFRVKGYLHRFAFMYIRVYTYKALARVCEHKSGTSNIKSQGCRRISAVRCVPASKREGVWLDCNSKKYSCGTQEMIEVQSCYGIFTRNSRQPNRHIKLRERDTSPTLFPETPPEQNNVFCHKLINIHPVCLHWNAHTCIYMC